MATTNLSKINIVDMDFDDIKTSLKEYLSQQTEFVDFDFEGAGINILLDLLAVNTFYSAFFANMLANEMFLDTAVKRDSVVSHAKAISYTPSSIRAARAVADITVDPLTGDAPAAISLPRNVRFKATANNQAFSFTTIYPTVIKRDSTGAYIGRGIELVEGSLVEFAYEFDLENEDQRLFIPNVNADISTLTVKVRESINTSSTETYTLATDITAIGPTSKVYWLQETKDGVFEVYFGNGTVGKTPVSGNIIILEYLITNGEAANGLGTTSVPLSYFAGAATYIINNISYSTTIFSVDTKSIAAGGAERESIETIRFLAPRSYAAQNRAVTVGDYRMLINKNYPSMEAVAVWGGEEHDPISLGKVFISLKPYAGTELTDTVKADILRTLKTLNVVTIEPVIVDPDYTYLTIDSTVTYDPTITTKSSADIETIVFNTVRSYGDNQLEKFARHFRISKLTALIDNSNNAILGNITGITLKKRIEPVLNADNDFTLYFNNKIVSLFSSAFTYNGESCYLDMEEDTKVVRIYTLINNVVTVRVADAGLVNVNTGTVTLSGLNVSAYVGDYITVGVIPAIGDVETSRNQILIIDPADITIEVETDSNTVT